MDVAAVEGEIPRAAARPEIHERVLLGAGGGADLDADEAVIVRALVGQDGRAVPGSPELRHCGGLGGGDPVARGGEAGEGRGDDVDPPGAGFVAQGEGPGVRCAGGQPDGVARVGVVEGGLEVPAGGDGERVPRRGRVGRVEVGLGLRRRHLRLSGEGRGEQGRNGHRDGDQCQPRRGGPDVRTETHRASLYRTEGPHVPENLSFLR